MIVKRLAGVEQIMVIYPYIVEGSFSVVSKTPATGLYDAHFGLIINSTTPCHEGYLKPSETRPPQMRNDLPMKDDARCDEPPPDQPPRCAEHRAASAGQLRRPGGRLLRPHHVEAGVGRPRGLGLDR